MATPIVVQKTDTRAGVIVRAAPLAAGAVAPPAGPPTRVVLLRNMLWPGDVEPDVEDEVAEEASKHGVVRRVLVFEVAPGSAPPEQAVRADSSDRHFRRVSAPDRWRFVSVSWRAWCRHRSPAPLTG